MCSALDGGGGLSAAAAAAAAPLPPREAAGRPQGARRPSEHGQGCSQAGRRRQVGVGGAGGRGGGGALALGLFFGSRRPPGMPFALSRPGLLAEPRRASAIWGCLGVWAITTGTNKPGDFWRGRFFWGEYHTRAEFVPQFHFDWAAVRGLF